MSRRSLRKLIGLVNELIFLSGHFVQRTSDGLMERTPDGRVVWRVGKPDDEEARKDWRMMTAYMDAKTNLEKELDKMKVPIKDRETIPWMSKREIPAIKMLLSEWRKARKLPDFVEIRRAYADGLELPEFELDRIAACVAMDLETVYALEDRLNRESKKRKARVK